MHFFRLSLGLALATVAPGMPSLAAQVSRDTVALQEIVVTADRFPTPAARNIASTTVITGEELRERGVYFLDDALRAVPGAAVVPTGSYGGATSLFLRGGQSSYVKVLVDGVAQNQSGGLFNFLSGKNSRAPAWMQRAGLEWLYRTMLEPKRLFWRYLTTNPRALYLLFHDSRPSVTERKQD